MEGGGWPTATVRSHLLCFCRAETEGMATDSVDERRLDVRAEGA